MAILRNLFLEMFNEPQGKMVYKSNDAPKPDFTEDVKKEIKDRKEKAEGLTDEAIKAEIEKSFQDIDAAFSRVEEGGITETEKEYIDDMIKRQVDERLALLESHMEEPRTRILSRAEVEGKFLVQIAEKNGLTIDGLLALNPEGAEFHVVGEGDKRYCLKGDKVKVPLTATEVAAKKADDQEITSMMGGGQDEAAEAQALDQRYAERTSEQKTELFEAATEKVQGDLEKLGRAKWEIPARLNERNWLTFDTGGTGLRTAGDVISKDFGWNVYKFLEIANKGQNRIIRFDDIIKLGNVKDVSETSGQDFMEKYLLLEARQGIVAKELEDARKEGDKFREIDINEDKLREKTGDELADVLTVALTRKEGESLPKWKMRVDTLARGINDRAARLPATEQGLEKMRLALRLCIRASEQIAAKQAPIDKAQKEIQKRERYEQVLNSSIELFDALARLTPGEEQSEVETSQIDMSAYSPEEQESIKLMEEAFSGRDLEATQYELSEGDQGHGKRNLNPLTRRYTLESARTDMMARVHTGYEGGRDHIDAGQMKVQLKNMMIEGLRNYSMNPKIDLVKVAKELGIDAGTVEEDIKELKKALDKEVKKNEPNTEEINKLNKLIRAKNDALVSIIEVKFKNMELRTGELTDTQREFIQLGYLHSRTVELGAQRARSKAEIVREYTGGPNGEMINALVQDVLTSVDLTPQQTEELARSISEQVNRQMTLPTAQAIEEAVRASIETNPSGIREIPVAGVMLIFDPVEGIQNIVLSPIILPYKLGFIDIPINMKKNGYFSIDQILPGYGKPINVIDTEKFDVTVTPHVNVLGASVTASAIYGREGKLQLGVGGSLGVSFIGLPPSVGAHVSLQDNAADSVEMRVEREMTRAQLDQIPDPAQYREASLREMRKLPQFQAAIEGIDDPAVQDEVLIYAYNMSKQQADYAGKEKFVQPVRGLKVGFVTPDALLTVLFPNKSKLQSIKGTLSHLPAVIPIAFITVTIGSTRVVPFITKENEIANLLGVTDPEIRRDIEQAAREQKDRLLSANPSTFMAESGRVQIDPETGRMEVENRTLNVDLGRGIDAYNEVFAESGITLARDERVDERFENRAFRLSFAKNMLRSTTVELHMDGQTEPETHLITGDPSDPEAPRTLDNLYLAFDRMQGNLTMEMRTINMGGVDEFGNTNKMVITIKTNPFRSNEDIQRDEASYLTLTADRSVREVARKGAAKRNGILSWDELKGEEGATHREEILSTKTPEAYEARLTASHERIRTAINGKTETATERLADGNLSEFAKKIMPEISTEFKGLSTMQIGPDGKLTGIDYADLTALINIKALADTTIARELDTHEMNYIVNRLVVESFHQNRNPEALKATIDRFFQPQLEAMFVATNTIPDTDEGKATAKEFASTIIASLNYEQLLTADLETQESNAGDIPRGASMLTIVGTNGISGLRQMLSMDKGTIGNLLNTSQPLERIPVEKRPQFRQMALELSSALPEAKGETFLRSPLAIKFAELAPILLGPDASDNLAKLYEMDQAQLNAVLPLEPWKGVYAKFEELVKTFRDHQVSGDATMVWTNADGMNFVIRDTSDYWTGVYRKCANPGLIVNESFAIKPIQGTITLAQARALQGVDFATNKNLYDVYVGVALTEWTDRDESKNAGNNSDTEGDANTSDDSDDQTPDDPDDLDSGH